MIENKFGFKKWNSTKSYVGEYEKDEVTYKEIKVGPGGIYNTPSFLNKYDGYTIFDKISDGKIHGNYFKCSIAKKLLEFGVKRNGKNEGPCFAISNKGGYFVTYDEKENEHGFYVKFIDQGYDFIIFYFNHGKLSSRCLINRHNELFFGECSSLNNYKRISDDKITLPFYPSFMYSSFEYSFKGVPDQIFRINEENPSKRKTIGWQVYDSLDNSIFGCFHLNKYTYIGEISNVKAFGYGIRTYSNGMAVLGRFYEDKKSSVLVIEKNKNYLQEYDDDVLDGYSFINQYDYFLIKKHEKGKLFDKLIRIEKDTLDVSIYNSNGHCLSSYPYLDTSKKVNNKSNVKEEIKKEEISKKENSSVKETRVYQTKKEEKKEEKVIKQGYQKVDYDNGRYEGKYSNDLRSGHGVFYFNNNDRVEGTWENDKMNGYGNYYYANGDKYEGFFKDGLFHGRGSLFYKNGEVKVGYWENGKIKESLRFDREYYENGYYEGEFLGDERHGLGVYYFNSGSKYEGRWVHNEFTGRGKFYSEDGTIYEGYFINGELNGHCEVTFKNGDYYSGEFKNNKRHGDGIYFTKDGYKYYQYYKNGKRID